MKRYRTLLVTTSLLILAGVVWYSNPAAVASALLKSDYRLIALGFGIAFFTMLLGVMKWKILLGRIGFWQLFPVQLLGFTISNFTPGKAGEPAKAVMLKMVRGVHVSHSLPSIIWERITDVIALLLFSLVTISTVSAGSNFFMAGVLGILVFVTIITVSLTVIYSRRFGRKLFAFVRRFPLLRRLPENFMELFYTVKIKKRNVAKSLAIAIFTWFLLGFVLYLVLLSVGIERNPFVLAGIVSLSIMVGIASSLPGGVGTTEVVMIILLGLIGVEGGVAAAVTIIFRLMTIWFVNVLGGLSFLYLSRKFDLRNVL